SILRTRLAFARSPFPWCRRLDCTGAHPVQAGRPRHGKARRLLMFYVRFVSIRVRIEHVFQEHEMNGRPRTKAAKKRRVKMKKERREKKTLSRVMPMLSRPKKLQMA